MTSEIAVNDAYQYSNDQILEPPKTIRKALRYLGPSFILSASIVGSGELIATTTLGAQAGFVTFWVIIVSCLVKVVVQVEFGKHTILSGETAMTAFDKLPGPSFGKAKWSVWSVLVIMVIKLLQVGGIVGGVAIILNMLLPHMSISIWAFAVSILAGLMIFRGYYQFIERFSISMIVFFTVFTFASLYFLSYTPYALSWSDIASGLQFQLPRESLAIVFGAFGITGVGADEIIHYNYWCLEKGYARHTGPREDNPEWDNRAKGWIKVMYLDAVLAMIIYTIVTMAFYLLGAAVLHTKGDIPGGFSMIETLSDMYTMSLGPWAKPFFMVGSFVVLFSTVFAALAAWTRQISDIFGRIGWINFEHQKERERCIAILAWCIPIIWAALFVFIQLPVVMVITGGIAGSLLLYIVAFAAISFRYQRTHHAFIPGKIYDTILWISILAIFFIGIYGLLLLKW